MAGLPLRIEAGSPNVGLTLSRAKPRVILWSLLYRVDRLLSVIGQRAKLRFYLDLSWMTARLAHEYAVSSGALRECASGDRDGFWSLRITPKMRLLDLGCGRGEKHSAMSEIGAVVTGVDSDSRSLSDARRRNPQCTYHQQELRTFLESNKEPFDALFLSHVLEHLDDAQGLLSHCAQRFRLLFVEVPDFEATHLNPLRPFVGTTLAYTDDDHVREFDRRELLSMLDRAGYRVLETEYRFGLIRVWAEADGSPK